MADNPKLPPIPTKPGARHGSSHTLLRAQSRDSAAGLDIAIAGVPFDMGTLGRPGSRLGPAQVREYSFVARPMSVATGIAPFELCRIADVGDAPIRTLDTEGAVEDIAGFFDEIVKAGASPLAIGGDHTISLPILRAVAKAPKGPVALVHFDAHPDTNDVIDGSRINYATPFRRSAEEGLTDPKRHVMLGIRGMMGNADAYNWARDNGVTILAPEDVQDLGPIAVAERIRAIVGETPVYVTFDLDGLDPVHAPGTGLPEPGGLSMLDCQRILRGLAGLEVIGGDVNEIAPPFDPTGQSAIVANHLMFEILCLIAQSRTKYR